MLGLVNGTPWVTITRKTSALIHTSVGVTTNLGRAKVITLPGMEYSVMDGSRAVNPPLSAVTPQFGQARPGVSGPSSVPQAVQLAIDLIVSNPRRGSAFRARFIAIVRPSAT